MAYPPTLTTRTTAENAAAITVATRSTRSRRCRVGGFTCVGAEKRTSDSFTVSSDSRPWRVDRQRPAPGQRRHMSGSLPCDLFRRARVDDSAEDSAVVGPVDLPPAGSELDVHGLLQGLFDAALIGGELEGGNGL